jgi:transmembrane sensor
MDQEKLAELIQRYKSGKATPEEVAILEEIWHNAVNDEHFTTEHTERELQEMERDMLQSIQLKISDHERHSRKRILMSPSIYKIAATLLILSLVLLGLYSNSSDTIEIRTGFGERLAIHLPDNSEVVLNGNTKLSYSKNWDRHVAREVWIDGEAFFSVLHTQNHQKFIVHSDQLNVEVLGTEFNIKIRDNTSEVMLRNGKVKLALSEGSDTCALYLKPGELATLKNRKLTARNVKQRHYTSWVENKLSFDRTPLRDVATMLKDTYGLDVVFSQPELEQRELSGEISSATEHDILRAIAETFDLDVDKRGNSVTISFKLN